MDRPAETIIENNYYGDSDMPPADDGQAFAADQDSDLGQDADFDASDLDDGSGDDWA